MELLLQDRFLICFLAGGFGMIFGSFATALIYRLPREINWVSKRSSCTSCGKNLSIPDLIPIFSYIFLFGRCRHCKTSYSIKYLIIEILVATSFVLSFYFIPFGSKSFIIAFLAFAIIVLSVIDFEHYIIPDEVNIFILLLGIIYSISNNVQFTDIIINIAVFLFLSLFLRWIMFVWKKKEGLGLGDIKFFAAAGAFLSFEFLPVFLFISGITGLLVALFWRVIKKTDIFPFGPSLSVSLFFCVAFPETSVSIIQRIQEIIY